jgi:heme oxygenase
MLDARLPPSSLVSHHGYVRYLSMNWACSSIERALVEAGVHRFLPDFDQRQRRFALADDLDALAVRQRPYQSHAIENDAGTIFGWSYVLEGSRLGARQILKIVEISGAAEIRSATRFLRHGHGNNFWESFKLALSEIDHDEIAIPKACAAANAAFHCFIAC